MNLSEICLQPKSPLPWTLDAAFPTHPRLLFMHPTQVTKALKVQRVPLQDVAYIAQAANHFPEALQLLLESMDLFDCYECTSDQTGQGERIRLFLEKVKAARDSAST